MKPFSLQASRSIFRFGLGLALALAALPAGRLLSEEAGYIIVIKDHKLDPSEFEVPAGIEFTLLVKNADDTPEEFESEDLDLEKIIPGGAEAQFSIGPLEPGSYDVFGEFHEESARGKIIVK